MEGLALLQPVGDGHNGFVALRDPFKPRSPIPKADTEFNILFDNCTSFSTKIKSFMFSKGCREKFSAFVFVETKIKPSETNAMKNLLHEHNFHASVNPGEITPTGEGIHGGEMIAVNNNLNFKEIDKKVIQRIQAETGAAVHFAAGILSWIRFHSSWFIPTL